jgi:hypothetical protein
MERTLALIAVVLFATACTTLVYTARYDIGLSAVEQRERGGELKRFTDVRGHTFEDELVRVTWTPFDTQLGLILVNKTDSSQRVIWDDIRYAGPDGKSDRVIHEGVKIADRGLSMPPTVVIRGGTLLDLIEPIGHIDGYGKNDRPLIGSTSGATEAEVRSKMVHGTIKVVLPIEVNGTIRVYSFQFSVGGDVVLRGWSS